MSIEEKAVRMAQALFEARRADTAFVWPEGDLKPDSLEEGYAAQAALLRLLQDAGDGVIAGWKIAITSKAMQELCGIDQPCVGGLLNVGIQQSPGTASLANYGRLGLEFEIAMRIGQASANDGKDYDAKSVRALVDAVMPAFELVDDRNADYDAFDAPSIIADNTWNAGVILGAPIPNWQSLDWTTQQVTLHYNDEVDTAVTGASLGNPFTALAFVANNLAERGLVLKPGDIVITGSALQTRFAVAGDSALYAVDGFPAVKLTVSA